MNFNKIERKIYDLNYRIKLDEMAINKAQYNLKFAKRLGHSDTTIDNFAKNLEFYNSKIIEDRNTLSILKDCANGYCYGLSNDEGYLFKCTLPYEKVDGTSSYQTSILVNDNVARLFANGVSYKDIISCLDNNDIIDIDTRFSSKAPTTTSKNVGVEYMENIEVKDSLDEPILAYTYGKPGQSLIASSKITTCYPFEGTSCKDLDGETYCPTLPTFEDFCIQKEITTEKDEKWHKLDEIETTVYEKMQNSINTINAKLKETDANYSLDENFYTN